MSAPDADENTQPLTLPLLGHGGLLDDARHCLTSMGAAAGTLRHHKDPDVAQRGERLFDYMRRLDAIASLMQVLAEGGGLEIPQALEEDREWLAQFQPTELQMSVIERHERVRLQ